MAYYLAIGNGGTDEEVILESPIADQATNEPAIIKIKCSYGMSGNTSVYFLDAPSTVTSNYYILTPTAITLAVNGSGLGVISLTHGVNYNDIHEYVINYDGADLWLEVDGVESDRINGVNGQIFGFSKIHPDAITGSLNVYYIEYTRGATLTHRWDANASGGEGLTLPDTVAGNNGALSSFDGVTDSWWVFYDDGGGAGISADAAFSVSSPTLSVNTTATLPQPISDVAYTVSVPSVDASLSASLPNPNADVAYTVNVPIALVSASTTLPKPQADLSFAVSTPTLTANASATIPGCNASFSFSVNTPILLAGASATLPTPVVNIGYTVSVPNISADASASLPQPDSGITFTVNTPSVSAMAWATQTGWNADVNFTVNVPSVSISASATLPQPDATVSLAVSPPQVSVVAIAGGIAIIVSDETNINQRVLSNNIKAPILSNNINR